MFIGGLKGTTNDQVTHCFVRDHDTHSKKGSAGLQYEFLELLETYVISWGIFLVSLQTWMI